MMTILIVILMMYLLLRWIFSDPDGHRPASQDKDEDERYKRQIERSKYLNRKTSLKNLYK